MKKIMIVLITTLLIISCKNETNEPSPQCSESYVVLDEKLLENKNAQTLDTLIYPSTRCDSVLFPIDIDGNGTDDYSFYIYYCYSPCSYISSMRINCLEESNSVLCIDTIDSPEILEYGDTIFYRGQWKSDNLEMLKTNSMCPNEGGLQTYGVWHNINNKYIGLKIEKSDGIVYGWVEVSIKQSYNDFPLLISKYGYQKINCLNN